jgi:hypothetical protein
MTKIMKTIRDFAGKVLDIEKRAGLYVYRPVLNGQAWHDWAVKYGVPKPLAANDLHVTVLSSTVDVKMPIDETPMTIEVFTDYEPGSFVTLGPKDQSLVWTFDSWRLHGRNWSFVRNGAKPTHPTYRPHMTLTNEVGDFELPDDALRNMPRHIILGGEINSDIKTPDATDDDPDGVEVDDESRVLVVVVEFAAKDAQKALDADVEGEINVLDRLALRDIAAEKSITMGVAKRLAAEPFATDAIKALAAPAADPAPASKEVLIGKRTKEVDMTVTLRELPQEIAKSCAAADVYKTDDEERLVWGWASVSTVGGELLEDMDGHKITTGAQRQFLHQIMCGQRAGKFDHEGEVCNEVVEGIVLDHDLQKALGIDLGMEGMLICTHVPDDKNWEDVKKGNWMYSIAGTVVVEFEEGEEG